MQGCHCKLQDWDFSDMAAYLSSHGIIVSGSGEGAAQLADLSSGFVNGNNISERQQRKTVRTTYGCPKDMNDMEL